MRQSALPIVSAKATLWTKYKVSRSIAMTKYTYDGTSNVLSLDVQRKGLADDLQHNWLTSGRAFQYNINGRIVKDDKGRKDCFGDDS